MIKQKAVEELLSLAVLGGAEFQPRQGEPARGRELFDNESCAGREFGFRQIRLEAQFIEKLEFKSEQGLGLQRLLRQHGEKLPQQFKNDRQRRFLFRGQLDERGT